MGEFRRSLAYVIGIDHYEQGIPPLRTAGNDARRLGEILGESHGYEVTPLTSDVSLAALTRLFRETLPRDVGPDDRVVVYFAGHGIALDGEDGPRGYLVPQDARRDDSGMFLPMVDLNEALCGLSCRHLLVILDCCFAGAFRWSSTRDLGGLPEVIYAEHFEQFTRDPAWQAITSAAHDQKALDVLAGVTIGLRGDDAAEGHSPFAIALFDALTGEADLVPSGGDGIITATELQMYLRDRVEQALKGTSRRQTPMLWPLQKHDKGEYIFFTPGQTPHLEPAPAPTLENNPYRGLTPYDEEHGRLFFGREDAITALRGRVETHPLAVVLGASGSGKSSLVKAGLVPRLRKEPGGGWKLLVSAPRSGSDPGSPVPDPVARIRPGISPLSALASVTLIGENGSPGGFAAVEDLWADPRRFAGLVREWSEAAPGVRLVLVVDQSEELVTLGRDRGRDDREQRVFVEQIAHALETCPALRVVLTLRSDFEPQLAGWALMPYWDQARFAVPPLSHGDLREVIVGPARETALYFEPPDLVDGLIGEVVQSPTPLPLLSFVLSEMYVRFVERRGDDRALVLPDNFAATGGVAGALSQRATDLHDRLPEPDRQTLRRLMLRMVTSEGGEFARRRVALDELDFEDPTEVERIRNALESLIEARLVVRDREESGTPFAEPAHDKLIRGWDRLWGWIMGAENDIKLRRRLTPIALEWKQDDHRKARHLWNGNPRLPLLQQTLQQDRHWFNRVESDFIRASVVRAQTLLKTLIGTTVAIIVALLSLTLLAQSQRNRAEKNATEAVRQASDLLTEQGVAAQEGGDVLLASRRFASAIVRRHEVGDTDQETRTRLASLLQGTPTLRSIVPDLGPVDAIRFTPDGRRLIVQTPGAVRIINPDSAQQVAVIAQPGKPTEAWYSPDGSRLVARFGDAPDLEVWDLVGCRLSTTLKGHEAGVFHAAFSPDGRRIVTASSDGTARLWDASQGVELHRLDDHEQGVLHCGFDAQGTRVVTASDTGDDRVRVWDAQTGKLLFETRPIPQGVSHAEFAPDGSYLISAPHFSDDKLRLWDPTDGHSLGELPGHQKGAIKARILPGAGRVVAESSAEFTAGDDLWIWDARSRITVLRQSRLSFAAACESGDRIVTLSPSGATVWNTEDGKLLANLPGASRFAVLSPDERRIATGYRGNSVAVWGAVSGQLLWTIGNFADPVAAVAFDADSGSLATATPSVGVQVWEIGSRNQAVFPRSHRVYATIPGPSGDRFVTVDRAASTLWDARSRRTLFELRGQGTTPVTTETDRHGPDAQFSPDGRRVVFSTPKSGILGDLPPSTDRVVSDSEEDDGPGAAPAASTGPPRDPLEPTVFLVDAASGRVVATRRQHVFLGFGPDGSTTLESDRRRLAAYRTADGASVWQIDLPEHDRILLSDDGQAVVLWSRKDNEPAVVQTFNPRDGRSRHRVSVPSGKPAPDFARLSAGGTHLLACSFEDRGAGNVFWSLDLAGGKPVEAITLPFAARERPLAVPVLDYLAWRSESTSGKPLPTLEGTFAALDRASATVATRRDNLLLLWDGTTGERRAILQGHAGAILGVAFEPGGKRLVSAATDGSTRVWDAASGSVLGVFADFLAPLSAFQEVDNVTDIDKLDAPRGRDALPFAVVFEAASDLFPALNEPARLWVADARFGLDALATSSYDGMARIRDLTPVRLPADRLLAWVEALTGTRAMDRGGVAYFSRAEHRGKVAEVAELLRRDLSVGEPSLRIESARALLRIVPDDPTAWVLLARALRGNDPATRREAESAVRDRVAGSVAALDVLRPALSRAIDDRDEAAVQTLLRLLDGSGPSATPTLLAAFDRLRGEPLVLARADAVRLLARTATSGDAAAGTIVAALGDPSEPVRRQAEVSLEARGTDLAPALIRGLATNDATVRLASARLLSLHPTISAAPTLVTDLTRNDAATPHVRKALASLGLAVVPNLVAGLKSPSPAIRTNVLGVFQVARGELDRALGDVVRVAVEDEDPGVRGMAIRVLKTLPDQPTKDQPEPPRVKAERGLLDELKAARAEDRLHAVEALKQLGAVFPLIDAMNLDDPPVRDAAGRALLAIGGDGYLGLMDQGVEGVRLLAKALQGSRTGGASGSNPKRPDVIPVDGLWEIHREALPDLAEALRAEDRVEVRLQLARGLMNLGAEGEARAQPVLEGIATDSTRDPDLRLGAAEALAAVPARDETRAAALAELIRVESFFPSTRQSAIRLLGRIGDRARVAIPALIATLRDDKDTNTRQAAARALGEIAPSDPEVAQALDRALGDKVYVSVPAAEALAHSGRHDAELVAFLERNAFVEKNPLHFRNICADTLVTLREKNPEVNAIIDRRIRSEDPLEQVIAGRILIQDPTTCPRALPALFALLDHRLSEIREGATVALRVSACERDEVARRLLDVYRKSEGLFSLRFEARTSLVNLGREARSILPALLPILEAELSDRATMLEDVLIAIGPDARPAGAVVRKVLEQKCSADLADDAGPWEQILELIQVHVAIEPQAELPPGAAARLREFLDRFATQANYRYNDALETFLRPETPGEKRELLTRLRTCRNFETRKKAAVAIARMKVAEPSRAVPPRS